MRWEGGCAGQTLKPKLLCADRIPAAPRTATFLPWEAAALKDRAPAASSAFLAVLAKLCIVAFQSQERPTRIGPSATRRGQAGAWLCGDIRCGRSTARVTLTPSALRQPIGADRPALHAFTLGVGRTSPTMMLACKSQPRQSAVPHWARAGSAQPCRRSSDRRAHWRRACPARAAAAGQAAAAGPTTELLAAVAGTQRGLETSAEARQRIEVGVRGCG